MASMNRPKSAMREPAAPMARPVARPVASPVARPVANPVPLPQVPVGMKQIPIPVRNPGMPPMGTPEQPVERTRPVIPPPPNMMYPGGSKDFNEGAGGPYLRNPGDDIPPERRPSRGYDMVSGPQYRDMQNSSRAVSMLQAIGAGEMSPNEIPPELMSYVDKLKGIQPTPEPPRNRITPVNPMLQYAKGGKVSAKDWEGSAKDEAQDKKLAKKHKMSMKDWEKSKMDDKHDKQQSMKGLKKGGATKAKVKKMCGGGMKGYKAGGAISGKKADGIAVKGKTRCKIC